MKIFLKKNVLPTVKICTAAVLVASTEPFCLTVTVDPAIEYQLFEGWGTSLCWWAVAAGEWDEENRNHLIGAIVDPDTGLGYNCFRYNIGGGDHPDHTHIQGSRAVPGFKATEDGDYDWNADENQRSILLGIAARGKDLIFEAFSNSPPWWMTISGCASGNTSGADNLKPAYFTAFADYLATVVKYYKDTRGIVFRTVEPFNEPSSGYWKPDGAQEGCGFRNEQARMVKELGRQLAVKGLFPATTISAADETSLAHTVTSVGSYDDSAMHYLSQINSHSYEGWESREKVYALAQDREKNLWQSESGPLRKSDNSDITMWMSHVIIQDVRVMKANAWIDWQVCDPAPDWQSIELRGSTQRFNYKKRYYMHAAFSRFIRPGSRIISSSDTNSIAALVPATGNLVVLLRNNATTSVDYLIDLSKCATSGATARIYRFALPGSLNRLDDVPVDKMQLSFAAPGQTITACVIPESVSADGSLKNSLEAQCAFGIHAGTGGLRLALPSRSHYRFGLYNCAGRKIMDLHGRPDAPSVYIDLTPCSLSNGMYVAEVRQGKWRSSRAVYYGKRQD